MADPALKRLMDQFVCVRLVQMGGVDLSLFQFDPFLSFAVLFMNADQTLYGRYGTASPKANRATRDSNPNHTLEGLRAALAKALEVHAGYTGDPGAWAPRLAGKTGPAPRWRYVEKTPSARKYKRLKRVRGADSEGCVHCHEVLRTAVDSYAMKKLRVPDRMLWVYPHPDALGLTLSRDHCATVTAVAVGSAAGAAGLQVGDELLTLADQPLGSVADVQWVLHNVADEGGELVATVLRDGAESTVVLSLPDGWRRKGDFGWRYRLAGYAMWLWGGVTLEDDPKGVRVAQRSPGWFKRPNRAARKVLQAGDIIVKVDGKAGWTRSTYLAYLMRDKRLGAKVELEVLRGGKRQEISFRLPKQRPEVMGY